MRQSFEYRVAHPQTVRSGIDALESLEGLAGSLGLNRVLIITSPSLLGEAGVVDKVVAALGEVLVAAVYSGAREHTPIETIEEAYDLAVEEDVDGIVSVGGGSAMDTGKGTGLAMLGGSAKLDAYVGSIGNLESLSAQGLSGQGGRFVPLIAIPTTLSAAEATMQAGITLHTGIKEQFYHPAIQARGIVLDPSLTLETPEGLWLSTGVKALDHSVEVAYSRLTNDLAQGVALNSIRLLNRYLPLTKLEPENLEYRHRLQTAAWMILNTAIATLANVGLDHAIVHRLGGYCGIAHGTATAITLPHTMEFNRLAATEELAMIAKFGFGFSSLSPEVGAENSVLRVRELISELGLPQHLREYIEDHTVLSTIAPMVLTDTAMAGNPRKPVTVEEVEQVLEAAW